MRSHRPESAASRWWQAALPLAAAALSVLGAAMVARADGSSGPSSWREGAAGYRQASAEAVELQRPMVVYFRTDWCPYCRELEQQLLTSGVVEGYLRGLSRVRVNPESGAEEDRLAQAYGVSGYPALFVQARPGDSPARVSRTARDAQGQQRLKTPQEFVAALQKAVAAP